MSAEQTEPVSGSHDNDKSSNMPSSSDITTKTESSNDSKDFPNCAVEKSNILSDETGDHGDSDELSKNTIENITNVNVNTEIGTEIVGENNENSLEFKETVPINISEIVTNDDKQSSVSENKTSDDDEEEMQLRWDDDDDEEQEKSFNDQEATKKNISDIIVADKSSKSAVKEIQNTMCESSKEIKNINIDGKEIDSDNFQKKTETTAKNNVSARDTGSDTQLDYSDQAINIAMEVDDQNVLSKSDILSSTGSDSFLDASIEKVEHGLNKPDMMLEIPTQEIVEFSDEDSDHLDSTNKTAKRYSGSSGEENLNSTNTDPEVNTPSIDTSGVIDVDMECSSVNSEIMLKYDDTDQPLSETGDISTCSNLNIGTSGIDVDMESTSVSSEIMLQYDDQPLNEKEDLSKNTSIRAGTKTSELAKVSISNTVSNEDMELDASTPEKDIQKGVKRNDSKSSNSSDTDDLDKNRIKDTITELNEDIEHVTGEIKIPGDPHLNLNPPSKIEDLQLSKSSKSSAKPNTNLDTENTEDVVDNTLDTIITNLDEDIKNLTDEIEISDDIDMDVDHPSKTDETVVDTIITELDEDIKNLTEEIEISDDQDITLHQPKSKAEDLEVAQTSSLIEVEDVDDKVIKDTIAKLDEDIEDLTDEIEISDDIDINLVQSSKSKGIKVSQLSSLLPKENIEDEVIKDTIAKLDEDIKNLTDEIEVSDDLDVTLEQQSKDKDLEVTQLSSSKAKDDKNIHDKVIKDVIAKLDEDIKNLTDEIEESDDLDQPKTAKDIQIDDHNDKTLKNTKAKLNADIDNLDTNLDQSSKTEKLVQPSTSLSKETNLNNINKSQDETLKDTITKLDDDIKSLTDEIEESGNVDVKSAQKSKTEDLKIDFAKPSTSFAKDSVPLTKNDDKLDVQPSTSSELAPDAEDEVSEMTDSLGLLAESSRVMEEDEEADEDEDGDDDDDYDQDDESSNQMTAEHSEDSNAQHSDSKDQDTPTTVKDEFNFDSSNSQGEKVPVPGGVREKIDTKVDDKPVLDTTASEGSEIAAAPKDKSPKFEKNLENSADIETVKLSDTSDNETEGDTAKVVGILKALLDGAKTKPSDDESPSKILKTAVESSDILNIVDLDESSSEGDVQEVIKVLEAVVQDKEQPTVDGTEPDEGHVKKEGIQEPKTPTVDTTPVIVSTSTEKSIKSKFDLEVFNLDSDEEDMPAASKQSLTASSKSLTALEMDKARESNKCINYSCTSGPEELYSIADLATVAYYDAGRKRKALVCQKCGDVVRERSQALMKGIKELTPLLNLDMKASSDLVEISDSESEEENDGDSENKERIGEIGAKFLEEQLADMINETWRKYKLDARLNDAQDDLNKEMQMLEEESLKIDTMLNECQVATDKLRNELYATFEPGRKELTPVGLVENNGNVYVIPEQSSEIETRAKRRLANAPPAPPAKRPAIPLGYTPLTIEAQDSKSLDSKLDDDKDISVVKLSMEVAPSDLPPKGEISRPPLRVGMSVYAMRNTFCSWLKVKITEVHPKGNNATVPFTMCRVKFDRVKVNPRVLPARCLAYAEPADVRLTIGTRVIALFRESTTDGSQPKESFYSGIVSEIPNPVNKFRYLIFFDDGYAQYVKHCDTRVVCESAALVWEEVHPFSRDFVRKYLLTYPERPMVRLHAGQSLKTEWNGKWWVSKVIQVDASLVQVHFEEDNRTEWIYRGSTRLAPLFLELQAAERQRSRPMPRSNQRRMNMPYVEYTRSDEQGKDSTPQTAQAQQQHNEELRRQRAVAKKSTVPPLHQPPPPPAGANLDSVTSRVVYYTPKNAVKPYKMVKHTCSPQCKRSDVLALKDLRTYNPLAKPLLSGWERQVVRFKGHKEVMYRAPCGRRLRSVRELHRYLQAVRSDMPVDLFDFHPGTHCLAEFVLNKCLVGKKDLSHGKENVPVPCVNYYDDSLPEFCSYNTERTPTAGVPLNIDPDFLCGCDCEDDCEDKSKCACWQMTLEGARTIGLDDSNVGYEYKRLPEPLPSGIYECNSRCKCRQTCLNRVAQHPLQLKLQVFKTYNRGWGIRALNDVPKGSFLCVYAGNLLTDATANLDGLNEGDEYLAELDYIEVVEQMKEGYEEDIPDADKKLDKMGQNKSSEEDESSTEEEEDNTHDDKTDDDFRPGFIGMGLTDFDKRLRKREKKERKIKAAKDKRKEGDEKKDSVDEDGCITISDDEEVREPSSFMAQTRMDANYVSKYRSVRSYFGKDEACYIMDAKVQGNIGRYLNHSCTPNVFVQNVFVDTHDPRFPWVAFFALSHIRAGTELTWNYNYDIGSVPGKVLYCYCGAPNCRGRLL